MQGELQFPKDFWRLTLPMKFDEVAQKELEVRIQEILMSGYTKLELDLKLVESMTGPKLCKIAMTCLDLKAKGIQVTVVGIQPKIQGMLDRNGLSDLLAAAKL